MVHCRTFWMEPIIDGFVFLETDRMLKRVCYQKRNMRSLLVSVHAAADSAIARARYDELQSRFLESLGAAIFMRTILPRQMLLNSEKYGSLLMKNAHLCISILLQLMGHLKVLTPHILLPPSASLHAVHPSFSLIVISLLIILYCVNKSPSSSFGHCCASAEV